CRHPEQIPESVAGQPEAQQLIWVMTPPSPLSKLVAIPAQTLEIQETLTHRPMPRLMHPQHTVHTLHRAAGSHRPTQYTRHRTVRIAPSRVHLLAHHLLNQMGHMAHAVDVPREARSGTPPAQPPQPHQLLTQLVAGDGS